MLLRLPSETLDNRVTIRLRVSTGVAEALYDEASHRRESASRLAERIFRSGLPEVAEERVRNHVSLSQLTVVRDDMTMPPALAEGISDSISPQDSVDQILPGGGNEPTSGGHAGTP